MFWITKSLFIRRLQKMYKDLDTDKELKNGELISHLEELRQMSDAVAYNYNKKLEVPTWTQPEGHC